MFLNIVLYFDYKLPLLRARFYNKRCGTIGYNIIYQINTQKVSYKCHFNGHLYNNVISMPFTSRYNNTILISMLLYANYRCTLQ